ncbi:MAG: NAD(P)/FAD-dependent oxidoreductase [Spirochaetia bacterium]|nr:NAD(P)/FAD-dependent oxidoreductase [Spirochaetia bacterium]
MITEKLNYSKIYIKTYIYHMQKISTDVIIIGGGMAGLSSAIWCKRLGLKCIVLEENSVPGGQLNGIGFEITDYPGRKAYGKQFAQEICTQAEESDVIVKTGEKVLAIDKENHIVRTDSFEYSSRALIYAAGLQRRAPNFDTKNFNEIYYSVSQNRERFQNRRVVIVGGGDGAYEAALNLHGFAASITIVSRSVPRAHQRFLREVKKKKDIVIFENTEIAQIVAGPSCFHAVLSGPEAENFETAIDILLVKTGFEPNSGIVQNLCSLDAAGYILTDSHQKTDAERIWAVGDVCNALYPSLSACAGHAGVAVKNIASTIFNKNHD